MTPLTHAVVGTVIYHQLRHPWAGRFGWVLAFLLAFVSHYLLDALPHFEGVGPWLRYRDSFWVFVGLGLIGAGLAVYLFPRNRQAGLLWLLLSLWIGLAGTSEPMIRLVAALALFGYMAYRTRKADAVGYLLAGILAVAADLVPRTWSGAVAFHSRMHYQVDWGTYFYFKYQAAPAPLNWPNQLQNPYFLAGYGLEMLVEALIFLAGFYVFSRLRWEPIPRPEMSETASAVASREGAGEPA